VGSTSTNHTRGKAADIVCNGPFHRFHLVRPLLASGFLGIGIGKDFIHCDSNRKTPRLWTY